MVIRLEDVVFAFQAVLTRPAHMDAGRAREVVVAFIMLEEIGTVIRRQHIRVEAHRQRRTRRWTSRRGGVGAVANHGFANRLGFDRICLFIIHAAGQLECSLPALHAPLRRVSQGLPSAPASVLPFDGIQR
jgi:hypothetical protein